MILYDDEFDNAVLSGGSWNTDLPLSNLQSNDIGEVARSSNALSASTVIDADFATASDPTPTIEAVVLGPSNISRAGFSPAATWQVRLYENSGLSPLIYDSGSLSIPSVETDLPLYLYHVLTNAVSTAGFARINIVDTGNADGYVEIGRLLFLKSWSPAVNYSEDNAFSFEPITDTVESFTGRRFFLDRGVRRRLNVTFPMLTETEIFDDVTSISIKSGISGQVFVIPNTADSTYPGRRNFLATMARAPAIRQLLVELGSTSFEFEEVL